MSWVFTMYVFGTLFYLYLGYLAYKGEGNVQPIEVTALVVACLTLCVVIVKAAVTVGILL